MCFHVMTEASGCFALPAAKVGLAFRRRGCSPWIFRCDHSGLDPLNEMMGIMKQNQVTSAGCGMIAVMQGCKPDFLAIVMSCYVLLRASMPTRRSCWATWSSKCNEHNDVESLNQIEPIKLFILILEAHCCCVAECLVLPFLAD